MKKLYYLQAAHQFPRWLADNGRIDSNPFRRVKAMNTRLDQRRRWGEFSPKEVTALLAATATSGPTVGGLDGSDRVMLYRTALGTGFPAAELAALTPDMFDLGATPPAVVLPPEFSKNRKGAVQPLAAVLAADLGSYLAGRPRKEPVWPGTWPVKAADMLRVDLAAAGVAVEVDGPEGIEVRDFHAFRNCDISDVLRSGADLKQAMTLARHSDPRLTTARYGRTRLHDLGAVVDKLPSGTTPNREPAVLRMTRTDPKGNTGAAAIGGGQGFLRTIGKAGDVVDDARATKNPLRVQGLKSDRGQSKTSEEEASPGFEPGNDGFANRPRIRTTRYNGDSSAGNTRPGAPTGAPARRHRSRTRRTHRHVADAPAAHSRRRPGARRHRDTPHPPLRVLPAGVGLSDRTRISQGSRHTFFRHPHPRGQLMSSYSDRARATVEARRRDVFRDWLAALPAGGWSGTAGDLTADLERFLAGHPLRFGANIPAGAGLSQWLRAVENEITTAGRRLGFTRTKHERLITIGART